MMNNRSKHKTATWRLPQAAYPSEPRTRCSKWRQPASVMHYKRLTASPTHVSRKLLDRDVSRSIHCLSTVSVLIQAHARTHTYIHTWWCLWHAYNENIYCARNIVTMNTHRTFTRTPLTRTVHSGNALNQTLCLTWKQRTWLHAGRLSDMTLPYDKHDIWHSITNGSLRSTFFTRDRQLARTEFRRLPDRCAQSLISRFLSWVGGRWGWGWRNEMLNARAKNT